MSNDKNFVEKRYREFIHKLRKSKVEPPWRIRETSEYVDFIDNVPPLNVGKMKNNSSIKLNSGPSNRVIYLHMVGAPSQLELFDYKPELL